MAYTTVVHEKPPQVESSNVISERLIKVLNEAVDLTLPKKRKIESTKEIWKEHELLNILNREPDELKTTAKNICKNYKKIVKNYAKSCQKLRKILSKWVANTKRENFTLLNLSQLASSYSLIQSLI